MAKNLTRCGEPLLRVRENVVKLNHAMERREYLLQRSRELQQQGRMAAAHLALDYAERCDQEIDELSAQMDGGKS